MPSRFLLFVCTSLVLVGACSPLTTVQRRFETETGCPARDSDWEHLGAGLIEVRGCGNTVRYICGGHTCIREHRRTTILVEDEGTSGGEAAPNDASREHQSGVAIATDDESRIEGIRARFFIGELEYRFLSTAPFEEALLSVHGRGGYTPPPCDEWNVRGVNWPLQMALDEGRGGFVVSLDELLDRVEEPEARGYLCGRGWIFDEADRRPFARLRVRLEQARGGEVVDREVPVELPSEEIDVEAAVRGLLDGEREALLACGLAAPMGLAASWDAEGALTVAPRGLEEDDPVAQCVQALFAGQSVEGPAGEAGELIHVVR